MKCTQREKGGKRGDWWSKSSSGGKRGVKGPWRRGIVRAGTGSW